MTLEAGLEAAFRYTVSEADTAAVLGSGDEPVLAQPTGTGRDRGATVYSELSAAHLEPLATPTPWCAP